MRRTALTLVLIAIVILGAAGYYHWYGGGGDPSTTSGTTPSLVSLLPQQAPYVLYADVAALRKSEFLSRLVAMVPAPGEDPEYSEFVRATGFDYSRDLDHVAIGVIPTSPVPEVWALAEGRFDEQRIAAYATRTGRTEQRDGHPVYVVPGGKTGGEVTITFVAPGRIQIVSKQTGSSATPAPANNDAANSAMRDQISRVAGSTIFAVVRADALPKDVTLGTVRLDQVESALHGVKWLTLAVVAEGANLRVVLEGETASITDAIQLSLGLEGFRMIGRSMLSDPITRKQFTKDGVTALDEIVRQISISRDSQRVQLMVRLSPEALNGLKAAPPAPAPTPQQKPPAKAPAGTKPAR